MHHVQNERSNWLTMLPALPWKPPPPHSPNLTTRWRIIRLLIPHGIPQNLCSHFYKNPLEVKGILSPISISWLSTIGRKLTLILLRVNGYRIASNHQQGFLRAENIWVFFLKLKRRLKRTTQIYRKQNQRLQLQHEQSFRVTVKCHYRW